MNTLAPVRQLFLVSLISMSLIACTAEQPEQAGRQQSQPPVVADVTHLERQDIELEKAYSALLRSEHEVTLVARVTGTLQTRHFEQGDWVEAGQLLYSIEPERYQALVQQREADLKSAQAERSRAQRDADRYKTLLERRSVSRQQYDQALADLEVARAQVAQAEAALASARIDLGYTRVTAPVSGRVGLGQVNPGNLVASGTELVTVTPLDPLEVRFQMPLEDAQELRQQLQLDDLDRIHARLELAGSAMRNQPPLKGRLSFLGVRVDERTSTVQAAATFANPNQTLLPGQFVRVHIDGLKRYNVLAVPEVAVTQGLMGPQVFVVDASGKARAQQVTLGEVAGAQQIILDGLEPGMQVVTGDPAGIKPGSPIKAAQHEQAGDA
ncbi:efflux RND transporter periplasmic adaptor subunit [Marinobacterium sp. AK62]|uniref:Efflux RND transporter periplasmic adaptor subunit n=1 Tax=Marinobacterium alkalitolerans TaxID=1542925 RepID=A0ABS3Z8F9_9GAMM|nr:efflux RND transporter periplasmic adaptor subunit [Marinobacterium alkalitolerans]MBP0047997.1 efflux RND transporter periplasmic adaptor subunit [Marinobacterium alkalitolerans]